MHAAYIMCGVRMLQCPDAAAAEMVFKVTEDFSNVVAAIDAAINITQEMVQEFGRCACEASGRHAR